MSETPRPPAPAAAGSSIEPWLRGPIAGVPPLLQPAAHALTHAAEEVRRVVAPLGADLVWRRPGPAATIAFHVRHAGGALDRLFTYARDEALSPQQFDELKHEGLAGDPPEDGAMLAAAFERRVAAAIDQLRATDPARLLDARAVGRRQLPSTVLGLLFHAAEHTQRHVGQIVTTSRLLGA